MLYQRWATGGKQMMGFTKMQIAYRIEIDRSLAKVNVQKNIVATMRTGDPNLLHACALLRQMEQSAAMAKINLTLTSYNDAVDYNPFSLSE